MVPTLRFTKKDIIIMAIKLDISCFQVIAYILLKIEDALGSRPVLLLLKLSYVLVLAC